MNKFWASLSLVSVLVGSTVSMNGQDVDAQPSNFVRIGGVDLNRYCRQRWGGSNADLVERTAWGWRCFSGNNRYSISVQDACKEQYRSYPVVSAYATNPRDPYSWGCFIPTVPLIR